MNIFRLLVLLAFLAIGLVVGSLNSQQLRLDFGMIEVNTTSGIALVTSLLAGVLLGGGLVVASTVLPLHARLRRLERTRTADGTAVDAIQTPAPYREGN
ncbi:hypothetical protein Psesu_1386 [Pseudoxanthomonas suwonensis 11-1]|uniref:Lipopolysaccharide assembly protein A domain-containing protein n=1 Tax=Pseudoxanthomonas suwonensis (strain 11-1) TaxID=743721 RepID=E6WSL9_PSEUU|nr:membrane protein [Pseudoxanthomonas suwonensis]ADV27233.1 hypothetical protein Psesu_1386 [Pseudoxanthomonas suwonensis 11-1]